MSYFRNYITRIYNLQAVEKRRDHAGMILWLVPWPQKGTSLDLSFSVSLLLVPNPQAAEGDFPRLQRASKFASKACAQIQYIQGCAMPCEVFSFKLLGLLVEMWLHNGV